MRTQDYGWLSAQTLGMAGAALAALLGAFVVIELRSKAPLVRLGIFRKRSLTSANVAMLAVAGGMFAVFYFASLYVQGILGFTPVQAGLAFLPLTAGIILFSGLAQPLIARVGRALGGDDRRWRRPPSGWCCCRRRRWTAATPPTSCPACW